MLSHWDVVKAAAEENGWKIVNHHHALQLERREPGRRGQQVLVWFTSGYRLQRAQVTHGGGMRPITHRSKEKMTTLLAFLREPGPALEGEPNA